MKVAKIFALTGVAAAVIMFAACEKQGGHAGEEEHEHSEGTAVVTNRVDIPASVRRNLGITFAKVERRDVARTLRVPGQFELMPTARREYRTPLGGRVELLVTQYQNVSAGTPLYRVDAAGWRDLHEQIAAMQAKVDSMGPLREAHKAHEKGLADKVALWQDRLRQLEELRTAGGGNAAQYTEARATLNETQAELADVMEKDAELNAQQKQAESELRSLQARHELFVQVGHCGDTHEGPTPGSGYLVCATEVGVIESLSVTPGGYAAENDLVLTVVQPKQIRFRARAMQSDLGRIREGQAVRIAPPSGGSVVLQDTMSGVLRLGLLADADERTVDLIVEPEGLSDWARAGVSAHLEITLDGGSTGALAIPLAAIVRDGVKPMVFRRDPANSDKVIRMEADVGVSDGRWVVIESGMKEGDEVVAEGQYQLMLATSGSAAKGGHFHPDGTFHEGKD